MCSRLPTLMSTTDVRPTAVDAHHLGANAGIERRSVHPTASCVAERAFGTGRYGLVTASAAPLLLRLRLDGCVNRDATSST